MSLLFHVMHNGREIANCLGICDLKSFLSDETSHPKLYKARCDQKGNVIVLYQKTVSKYLRIHLKATIKSLVSLNSNH